MTLRDAAHRLRDFIFDDGGVKDAPPRVREAIARQQERSEILVGWVQLAVITLFGGLYASARMAQGAVQDADPIPEFIAFYVVFTLLRLALAYARRLPPWMLYASAIVDMTLLMVTIWSYHLKYGQTAAFGLKAPTLLYVFIFIALRALRFEARYVIVAGVSGALGWTAMLLYVLSGYGGPPEVTRDYVEYMTSNATLIGAEIDKIIAILLVTAILALALSRARRLLARSVAETHAAQDLSRFFDPRVAERIRSAQASIAPGEGETRDVAILTCDLRGFTQASATMTPDDVMKLLGEYQARLCPAIAGAGGSIDKFLGDGILASFGAALESPTYAADALRGADAALAAADAWNAERAEAGLPPVRVGLAVAAGRVIFGAVGASDRLEYTVIGDAVNLAAKLEKHTKEERVRALADAGAYALGCAQGYAPPVPRETRSRRAVGGVAEPLDLVILAP